MSLESKIREDLWKSIQAHYERNDHTETIRDAIFCMSELIREKSGIEDKDGSKLVESALMGTSPAIMISKNETTTEKDIQQGIAFSVKGIMQSIRNPLSHEKISYTADEAEAIILYINYLLNRIDSSGGTTKIDNIMELLFDEDFTDTKEYADLLLKEIPAKKRFDLLLDLYYKRQELPKTRLKNFIDSLFDSLTKAAKSDFYRVVSKSLMKCKDDNDLRMYFHYFMELTYKDIEKLAQLRIEDLIIRSAKAGEVEYKFGISNNKEGKCNKKGSLATWISKKDKLSLLNNKDDIIEELFFALMSTNEERENYVFEYFQSNVFDTDITLTQRQTKFIKEKLKSGEERYLDVFFWDIEMIGEESPWYKLFKDEYAEGKKIMETREDLPF